MDTTNPTSDQVALIIAAACRETGASPLDVLAGKFDDYRNPTHPHPQGYPISRARVYAAAAINEMFYCGRAASSRMCGVGKNSEGSHLAMVYSGTAKWFSLDVLRRVASVIDQKRSSRITLAMKYPRCLAEPVEDDPACEFKKGDRVDHVTYGAGAVVGVGALNYKRRDYPLLIKFDDSRSNQTMYARVLKSAQPERSSPVLTQDEVQAKLPAIYSGLVAFNDRPQIKKQSGPELRQKHAQEFSGPLTMRKKAVPAHLCEDQTADLMGDPPKSRSAFGDMVAREISRQAQESHE
jgi:hypothetical protein